GDRSANRALDDFVSGFRKRRSPDPADDLQPVVARHRPRDLVPSERDGGGVWLGPHVVGRTRVPRATFLRIRYAFSVRRLRCGGSLAVRRTCWDETPGRGTE